MAEPIHVTDYCCDLSGGCPVIADLRSQLETAQRGCPVLNGEPAEHVSVGATDNYEYALQAERETREEAEAQAGQWERAYWKHDRELGSQYKQAQAWQASHELCSEKLEEAERQLSNQITFKEHYKEKADAVTDCCEQLREALADIEQVCVNIGNWLPDSVEGAA